MNERMVLLVFLGSGSFSVVVSVMGLAKDTSMEPVVDAVLTPFFWSAALIGAWGFCFLPIPRWWGPRWLRETSREERRPNVREPLSALMVGFGGDSGVRSAAEAAQVFTGSARFGSWRGNYVYEPDSMQRAHGLAPRGAVDGYLTAYEAGLVFSASRLEDNLRGESTVLAIDAEQVVGVRVVPARAGADGVKRKGVLFRSAFPRLVVDTRDGSLVFDFLRSRRIAERLQPLVSRNP
ncbi:MAG: hypothetical protein ACRDYU_04580 [Actinomycetes bacterium]